MKRVTMKEFFDIVGKLNVTVSATGNYPYKSEFRLKNYERALVGYIQNIDLGGFTINECYLCELRKGRT